MNRVQEALERYKQQNSRQAQRVQLFPVSQSDGIPELPPHQVAYTQTRSIEVPKELLERQRILNEGSSPLYVESYKRLKTQVWHRLNENGWTVLGIFSPRVHEGTTLTAVNLAIALGMDMTLTVLLVEGNLRNPSFHRVLGFPQGPGLGDFLQRDIPLKSCLMHPNLGRLVLLPAGKPASSSLELLTSPGMADLVGEMKRRYSNRLIIFDLPALLESADSLAFCPSLDAALLVVEEGRTTKADVQESLQLLQGGVPVLGTVCNKVGRHTLTLKSAQQVVSSNLSSNFPVSRPFWKRIFRRGD